MPYVYRAFDQAGQLLYIGRAKNWAARWTSHGAQRPRLFALVAHLELDHLETESEAAALETELIGRLAPIWNRNRPGAPEIWFRCSRCGMGYADRQDTSEVIRWGGRELWSIAGLCNDMSGHGGSLTTPCRGRVVPARY